VTTEADAAHGSRRRYQLGCRCPDCTRANTVYMRHVRAGARGTPTQRLGGFVVELGRPLWGDDD
jgi:hypothetical protein